MKHTRRTALTLLGAGLLAVTAPVSAGELFKFVDAHGTVHFTDVQPNGTFKKIALTRDVPGIRVFAPSNSPNMSLVLRRIGRAGMPALADNESYDDVIWRASRRHHVPPALVKAVIAAESAFDPSALSPKGAMGLMQLMPGTAEDMGVSDAFRDDQNVHGGTRYLRFLFDRYGDWVRTLAAYNAGPEAVERYDGVPPYPETRQYVQRVLSYYRRFHDDFAR